MESNNGVGIGSRQQPNGKKVLKKIRLNSDLELSLKDHDELLCYILFKAGEYQGERSALHDRWRRIDRDLSGYLRHDTQDCIRERDIANGDGQAVPNMRLPLAKAQLEEMVTYCLSLIMPDGQVYGAIAPVEQASIAEGFAAYMNYDARMFGHYDSYKAFFRDAIAYNFGALGVRWRDLIGTSLSVDATTGNASARRGVSYSGNELLALNAYNVIIDFSKLPSRNFRDGEYGGYVTREKLDNLQREQYEGKIFGFDDAFTVNYAAYRGQTKQSYYGSAAHLPWWLNSYDGIPRMPGSGAFSTLFYVEPPQIRSDEFGVGEEACVTTDKGFKPGQFDGIFDDRQQRSQSRGRRSSWSAIEVEKLHFYLRLVPSEWNLSESTDIELWEFVVIDGSLICYGAAAETIHDFIPIFVATPETDVDELDAKSQIEYLNPLQDYISANLMSHVIAQRKKLEGGLTIYDPLRIPLQELKDPTRGYVAARPTTSDQPLSNAIVQITDIPETQHNLQSLDVLHRFMQAINPTQQAQQVASLERATQYQAAATVQAGSRRQFTTARVTDSQALTPLRMMLSTNIMLRGKQLKLRVPPNGQLVEVIPQSFIDQQIEYRLSDGMRGLDRVMITQMAKDVMSATLQSRQAAAQIDVVKLLDWVMRTAGNETSLLSFKIQSQIDTLSPEAKDQAFQLLLQAQANGGQAPDPSNPNTGDQNIIQSASASGATQAASQASAARATQKK